MAVHIFGIRHHGPGCARGLRAALERLAPDIVLVEGPPDAHDVLPLLTHPAMRPPVALLIYAPDAPHTAVYFPFTHFSPEWQALRYALGRGIPAHFIDLPQAVRLAEVSESPAPQVQPAAPGDEAGTLSPAADAAAEAAPAALPGATLEPPPQDDPLALLAEAAGYSDHELWWERQIEQRRDAADLFEGILEAMVALRADLTPRDAEEAQREAHMRQGIRAAEREGFERIAVVCGAWHGPALLSPSPPQWGGSQGEGSDAALLRGLKRAKVAATWIPWTNSRLAARSGYGAGVTSPGWYEHLWMASDRGAIRWMARAAQLLRADGLDVSSASVIEAVRLGEALAALRDLPMPGLAEMHEAVETVLCSGEAAPMGLIRDQLEIGEAMGAVPPETPAVPLQRDLEAQQRRLRLPPSPTAETRDLDLRNDTDRARSQLLHRLRLLDIDWGEPQRASGRKQGTFHEFWKIQWQVEFAVALIEANIWGNTVATAATARARHSADEASDLARLTELLDQVILAELPGAVDHLLAQVQARAAVSADVRQLMDALPPLARVARYGDVRGTQAARVTPVLDGLFARVLVGLPGACTSLDDEAAQAMVGGMGRVQESLDLLDRGEQQAEWQEALRPLAEREGLHGLVRGRCCRLLLEHGALDGEALRRLARLVLSPVTPAPQAAAWVEGVLYGSGQRLLYQDGLWAALDGWLAELAPKAFTDLLPLLRRAFSGFHAPERRAMGEKVKHLRTAAAIASEHGAETALTSERAAPIVRERADRVLPVLAHILGVKCDGDE